MDDLAGKSSLTAASARGLSLRWRLTLLVIVGVVPLLVFSLGFQYVKYREDVARTGERTLALARSMSLRVEATLQAYIAVLQTLSISRELQAGDLETFRAQAETVVAQQFPGANILLLREDGQVVMSTLLPLGPPLPIRSNMESTRQAFTTGRPAVSNLFQGRILCRSVVAIDVPVKGADGTISYVLSLNPPLEELSEIIRRQQPPAEWVIGVFDRRGVRIARNPYDEKSVGLAAPPALFERLMAEQEGIIEDAKLQGVPVLAAFSHTEPFGWAVAIGVPRAELAGPASALALRTLLVGGVVLAIGLALAFSVARRIAGPIERLRRLAAATDRDALLDPPATGLRETDDVAEALRIAEENQRRSEQAATILRNGIDTMPAGFAIYDGEDRLVVCNQSYRDFYPGTTGLVVPGARFEDILRGGLARGLFADADGREEEWLVGRLRSQREPQDAIEQRMQDGRWQLVSKHRSPTGYVTILLIDISRLKAAEQALRVGEERFRRVVEAVANAIIMVGADGTIEMVNSQAEKIFGYHRAELLGRPIELLLPERYLSGHPGLRKAFFIAPQARLMGAGRELYALRRDGQEFPVEVGLSPIVTEDGTKVLASIVDITARRQAEHMGAYFAAIVDSTADAIIAKNLDGVVTSWNKSAELIFGYSASEMIGEPITRLLPPDRLDEESTILAQLRRGERVDHFETVRRRKDGTQLPVSLTISPILGPGGQIIGASKIARDISERLESEHQLRQERDTAQRYLDVADVMILVLDREANVKLINQKGCQVLGYDGPAGIVGKAWLDHFVPQRMRGTMEVAFDDLISGNLTHNEKYTNPVVTRTGEERLITWHNSFLTDSEGRIISSISSGEDITDRMRMEADLRTSEDRFRSIFAAVSEGIFIISPETASFTEANKAGSAMFGYTADEIVGTAIGKLSSGVPPYTQHEAVGLIERAKTSDHPQLFEWQCKTKDGHIFPAEISIGLASISGETVILATVRDVTERQTVEAQLRQAQKMEAIGNLTGGLAHDFNNLIGVIVGNLELARKRLGNDEDLHEMVGEALEAAWRGADLTRSLLAFSRRQPLRPVRIDLNDLVSNIVRLLRRLLGEAIEISLNLAEHVWPVMADPAQLEASLTNLATNARDAMPKGGLLSITTENGHLDADYAETHVDVTPGDFAVIVVSDTGMGMPPETVNQIFDPFFTTKEQGKGTGLGLSMVFGFMRQSDGHVNVYSEPGVGTTFRLYLPRVAEETAEIEVADAPAVARGTGETVLVVEDNPALSRVVLRQLGELGYRVLGCERAAAALEMLQREPVDLLFTDIVMPGGLDGIELARLAHERWPSLKIVLTSGFPQARANGSGEDFGGLKLLSKPYNKEELAAVLRATLDG